MTAAEVITSARRILADTGTPYEWSNTSLLEYVNDGVRDLVRLRRPDQLLTTSHTLNTTSSEKNIGDTLIVGYNFREGLAFYVASRALQEDSADKVNLDRAQQYWEKYLRSIS